MKLVYHLVYSKTSSGDFMNEPIGTYEAKTRLPELLRQVKSGRRFTITNRGEAIADLVPVTGVRGSGGAEAAKRLKAFMRADPVKGIDIRKLIDDGRA